MAVERNRRHAQNIAVNVSAGSIEEADIFDLPQVARETPFQFRLQLRGGLDHGFGQFVSKRSTRSRHVEIRYLPIDEGEYGGGRQRDDDGEEYGQAKSRGAKEVSDPHAI